MDSNEVVKQEKKKHGKNIVIIILVFVIALLLGIIIGQFAIDNNKKTDDRFWFEELKPALGEDFDFKNTEWAK